MHNYGLFADDEEGELTSHGIFCIFYCFPISSAHSPSMCCWELTLHIQKSQCIMISSTFIWEIYMYFSLYTHIHTHIFIRVCTRCDIFPYINICDSIHTNTVLAVLIYVLLLHNTYMHSSLRVWRLQHQTRAQRLLTGLIVQAFYSLLIVLNFVLEKVPHSSTVYTFMWNGAKGKSFHSESSVVCLNKLSNCLIAKANVVKQCIIIKFQIRIQYE